MPYSGLPDYIVLGLGTAALPSSSFQGDPNTGTFSPGADQYCIATAGVATLGVNATQQVGLQGNAVRANARVSCDYTQDNFGLHFRARHATYATSQLFLNADRAGSVNYNFIAGYSGNESDLEFKLTGDGSATCDGSFTGGGADYAEFFEWEDGNPHNEDRRGYSVVLVNGKIRKATSVDLPSSIIGVVSANPTVVGDAGWNKWPGKHLRDEFGSYVMEDYTALVWTETRAVHEDGDPAVTRDVEVSYAEAAVPLDVPVPPGAKRVTLQRRKVNPDFDPAREYTPRDQRPEWSPVGLMGKLALRKGQPVGDRWIKLEDVSSTVERWLVR